MCSIQIFTHLLTKTQLRSRLATWLGTKTNFFAQKKKNTEKDINLMKPKINSQTLRTQETKDLQPDCA